MGETLRRLKKAINWLIYSEKAENERALADLLGYTKSSFSQIVNGRVPLSEKFLDKLCRLDANLNKVWIKTGDGSMLLQGGMNGSTAAADGIVIPAEAWTVIKQQAASLTERDKQVTELIGMLREQVNETKKMIAQEDGHVVSAAVGG